MVILHRSFSRLSQLTRPSPVLTGPAAREFYAYARETGLRTFKSPAHTDFRCDRLFAGVPLRNRDVLDVGAGLGIFSAWAALQGARSVLALEPEVDGARRGFADAIQKMAARLELQQLAVEAQLFQTWEAAGRRFDVVLMSAVINHLDEAACTRLRSDSEARGRYREIFSKLISLMRPGGHLIVTDASNRNWFADRGLPAPLARSIEWEKHQTPELWRDLLHQAGFRGGSIDWYVYYPLRALSALVGRAEVAQVLHSNFRLVVEKPLRPAEVDDRTKAVS